MSSTIEQDHTEPLFADLNDSEARRSFAWLRDEFSAFRLLASNIIAVIFVTILALLSYEYLVEGNYETLKHILESTFVGFTLLLVIPPLLYIFSYRPLLLNMHSLRQTKRRLHLLATALESAEDGIVITDNQGNIQWSNPAFAQLTESTPAEMYGQNLRLVEANHGLEEMENRWEALLSGQAWKEELHIHRQNRPNRTEQQIITPVRNEHGAISHFIFLEKDVTEQRALEKTADILATASQTLNQSLNLNHVLTQLLGLLMTAVPHDDAAAILLDADGQWVIRACQGPDFAELCEENKRLPVAYLHENTLYQRLLVDRDAVLVDDTAVSPAWPPFTDGYTSHTLLGVPIVLDDEVIGFCILSKNAPNGFTPQLVELTKALASQAVAAIQNARLFEEVQAARERLQILSHRLVEIQESERRYIARELHDEAGQSLASLKIELLFLEHIANQPEAIATKSAELKQRVDDIAENLHRLATNLRPASLDHVGLLTALSQHVEIISSQYNILGQFEAIGVGQRLPAEVETAVYRIVQEALTNVIRHAQATRVDVILKQDPDKLIIIVEDDGIGFNPSAPPRHDRVNDHLGLIGIQERAEMLGGKLIVESAPQKGTTLRIEVTYDNPCTHC